MKKKSYFLLSKLALGYRRGMHEKYPTIEILQHKMFLCFDNDKQWHLCQKADCLNVVDCVH